MTYTKVGDEFPAYSQYLSDAAFRLLLESWVWSSARLLDLTIPKSDLRRFCDVRGDVAAAIEELIEAGWWQDQGESWHVGCRFPEWQMTREWVEHTKRLNRERVAKHRASKIEKSSSNPLPLPAGSQPNPTQPNPGNALRNALPEGGADGWAS